MRPLVCALSLLALACGVTPDAGPTEVTVDDTLHPTILAGTASGDAQNAVVMLVAVDPVTKERLGICTAAMIASNLALTARHCVSKNNGNVACDVDGTAIVGGEIQEDLDASQLYVFTGKDRPLYVGDDPPFDPTKWTPAGQGAELITDKATNLCNHDIAVVRLKSPIVNNPVAAVRLDGDEAVGEKLVTVGWGVASHEIEPAHRQERSGVTVKRVGPSPSVPVLTSSEFLFDESICLGDSGGPIFDMGTNAIVGVVSRGGNGETSPGADYTNTCTNADNVGTRLAPFKALLTSAYGKAGAPALLEANPEDNGCHTSRTRGRGPGLAVLAGLVALALRGRRRRAERPHRPRLQRR